MVVFFFLVKTAGLVIVRAARLSLRAVKHSGDEAQKATRRAYNYCRSGLPILFGIEHTDEFAKNFSEKRRINNRNRARKRVRRAAQAQKNANTLAEKRPGGGAHDEKKLPQGGFLGGKPGAVDYFTVRVPTTSTVTRRFLARPSALALSATGWLSPLPSV
ncbi:MAG: hypothetical protein ABIT83_07825 [Massilia sp.]